MAFKYTEIPAFTKRDGEALLFNNDGYLEYYIPDNYFGNGKTSSAAIEGAYVKLIGSFNYRIFDEKGVSNKLMTFNFPTMFTCRPNKIEKRKNIQLDKTLDPSDYSVLIFKKGDQLITRCLVEHNIDNVSELLRLHVQTGKIPNTIPYNELYRYLLDAMELNSGAYAVHSQSMGLMYSKICRDPDDISNLFRLSKAINKKMTGYKTISIKEAARYISPFASMIAENFDSSLLTAVMLSDDEKSGKLKHRESPLERLITM